jgi:hypothetical protein
MYIGTVKLVLLPSLITMMKSRRRRWARYISLVWGGGGEEMDLVFSWKNRNERPLGI